MTPKTILSSHIIGLEAEPVYVEVDVSPGLRSFVIVGLADKSVAEARERIFAALKNTGARPPQRKASRVIVNLAPADIKKEGTHFDLAIALGFLLASGQASFNPEKILFLGELGLKGDLKPIRGTLGHALMAKARGIGHIVVPFINTREARLVPDLEVVGVRDLQEVLDYLEGRYKPDQQDIEEGTHQSDISLVVLDDIRGQETVKRALEVAAAGSHNILMVGSPGAGKTLLAQALRSILPDLSYEEAVEVTTIHSIAGTIASGTLMRIRPFRNPHHTASPPAILGGGSMPKPGEVTLAHRGVLFLDEFPEFDRRIIEGLRQPLEDKTVRVARAQGTLEFPTNFMLVAAMNPCPCGRKFDPKQECICRPGDIMKYERKISQPILDRIDITLEVQPVELASMAGAFRGESSQGVRKRVGAARTIQRERLAKEGLLTNADMTIKHIERLAHLGKKETSFLQAAGENLGLTARGWHKVIKVSRTIADLAGSERIQQEHLGEALQYRPKRNE